MRERDPLCAQAMATNRQLRLRVEELERRLTGNHHLSLRRKLTVAEIRLDECESSPWTYLPWKGYAS